MDYEGIKKIVLDKLVNKTEERSFEDLSEELFGEGNAYNSSEVRKRMYGMKTLIEVIEKEREQKIIEKTNSEEKQNLLNEIERAKIELEKERAI